MTGVGREAPTRPADAHIPESAMRIGEPVRSGDERDVVR